MNMKRFILISSLLLLCAAMHAQQLTGTYLVAERDTCNLYIDYYAPNPQAAVLPDGNLKPTVLFVFGGGFVNGRRNDPYHLPWFKKLTDDGYGVVSVDYRLGLKGIPMRFDLFHLIQSAKYTKRAVDMGVEDVFAAIRFIADNSDEMGVDPNNLVISGSSAGAMISLSCALEVCSPTERTAILPEGFNFKGVMSFAGAIMSDSGLPSYKTEPAPHLLFHGTVDEAVAYNKIAFGRWGMYGSSSLVKEVFSKKGYVYNFFRYENHTHDVAGSMEATWPEQKRFLEENVIGGKRRIIDATLDDPSMPVWNNITLNDIYK